MAEEIKQAVALLDQIFEDKSVPKNIRESVQKSKTSLLDQNLELNIRINRAIQILDDIAEDPNMPVYTRTQIWNIVSLLESLSDN